MHRKWLSLSVVLLASVARAADGGTASEAESSAAERSNASENEHDGGGASPLASSDSAGQDAGSPLASAHGAADAAGQDAGAARRADVSDAGTPPLVLETIVKARRPQRVESLDVREVRERSAADLGGALAEAGLASRVRRGAIASDVVIRGFQRDAVPVTIGGAQVAGACPNRMDPPAFHVDAAEVGQVEVRKGPFDVTLPGVLGGSVNATPRVAKPGLNAEANLSVFSNAHGEGSLVAGWGAERFDVLGSYAYKVALPYVSGSGRPLTSVYAPTSPNRYRGGSATSTAYSIHTAWVQAGASLLGAGRDRLQIGYTLQKAEDVLYPFLLMDAVYDDTHRLNATWHATGLGPFAELDAQLYGSRVDHLMNDARRCSSAAMPATCAGQTPNGWSMQTNAQSQMAGARLNARLGADDPLTLGLDGYSRWWAATTTRLNRKTGAYMTEASLPDVTIVDVGAWAKHERRLGAALRLSVGARLDVVRSDAHREQLDPNQALVVDGLMTNYAGTGETPVLGALDVLPGGNVQLDWRVADSLKLWAGLGHAARPPDPQERYFALSGSPAMGTTPAKPGRIGDPTLRPMRNTELDVGLSHLAPRISTRAQLFGAWVTDAILVSRTMGANGIPALTYRNDTARLVGGEAVSRLTLPASFFVTASLSYTQGWNASGAPLQEVPPLSGRLAVRWDDQLVFFEAEVLFAAPQPRVDASVGEKEMAGWLVTNLRGGVTHGPLRILGGVTNLFDRDYVEHLNYLRDPFASGVRVPEPGRAFFLTLQVAL